ncbi:MAG: hypothetical protein NXI31_13035 [bacterium]|nr:hypothetical protein [bacterium]
MASVRWDRTVARGEVGRIGGRSVRIGLLMTVLATPSCMTRMLWDIDTPVARVVHLDRTLMGQAEFEAPDDAAEGLVVVVTPAGPGPGGVDAGGAMAIPDFSGLAATGSRWRLRPHSDPHSEAGCALALRQLSAAAGSPAVRLEAIELHAERERHDGRLAASHGILRLRAQVNPASVRPLPPEEFAAMRGLARAVPLVDHMPFEALGADEPPLLASCVARLRALRPRAWTREAGVLVGVAWLTADRRPLGSVRQARAVLRDEGAGTPTLERRLDHLARLRLLAVVRRGDEEAAFVLRADHVYQWGAFAFEPAAAGLVHESRWLVQALDAREATAPAVGVAGSERLPTGSFRVRCLDLHEEPRHGGDIFGKVLLTPFAIAVDIVSLSAVAWIWSVMTED